MRKIILILVTSLSIFMLVSCEDAEKKKFTPDDIINAEVTEVRNQFERAKLDYMQAKKDLADAPISDPKALEKMSVEERMKAEAPMMRYTFEKERVSSELIGMNQVLLTVKERFVSAEKFEKVSEIEAFETEIGDFARKIKVKI